MFTLDQSTWNTLFGWITGQQCFIPEGCTAPIEGIVVYAIALLVLAGLVWKRETVIERLRNLRG